MLISIVAVIVALVGLILYLLASNPKAAEIGRILFFCGVMAAVLAAGNHTIHLL
jgi:Na+/phosphate symporter